MHWLYQYVLRGIGILFVIGMITLLILAIGSQNKRSDNRPAAPHAHRHGGTKHFRKAKLNSGGLL
jgi:hypothetical protein